MDFGKIARIIFAYLVGLSIFLLIQRYFFPPEPAPSVQLESGRSRVAPKKSDEQRPLNLEVNFCADKSVAELITPIVTEHAKFEFTNYGGAIKSAEFTHLTNLKQLFKTFQSQGKEDVAFLVAFDLNTPFYYNLTGQTDTDDAIILTYVAPFDNGTINKKFIVYKHEYKIDLNVDVQIKSLGKDQLRLRVFYPAPYLPEIKDDVVNGICNEKNDLVKKGTNVLLQRYWEIPAIFGAEDKYFIHAMIKDVDGIVQRAYYKTIGSGQFASILETSEIDKSTEFNLSFYMGPKQSAAMDKIEPKLETTLDYGYLAPISKLMLAVLVFLYGYFKSYGIAIILLTLLIKLFLLPFTLKGEESLKRNAELKKKLNYIQQKYKHDKEALMRARTELMSQNGVGDMLGCLPILLQLPIGIALNRMLFNAVELYKAPFLWISDLSGKDPYYILPVLAGVAMVMHSATTNNDPKQKFSSYAVALVLMAFTAGLPAGLMLFIFVSIFSTVLQSKIYLLFKRA